MCELYRDIKLSKYLTLTTNQFFYKIKIRTLENVFFKINYKLICVNLNVIRNWKKVLNFCYEKINSKNVVFKINVVILRSDICIYIKTYRILTMFQNFLQRHLQRCCNRHYDC